MHTMAISECLAGRSKQYCSFLGARGDLNEACGYVSHVFCIATALHFLALLHGSFYE